VRYHVKPKRLACGLHQPGYRGCNLIFGSPEPGSERLPDCRAEFGDSFGQLRWEITSVSRSAGMSCSGTHRRAVHQTPIRMQSLRIAIHRSWELSLPSARGWDLGKPSKVE
jgi:hypothetical protein